MCEDVPLLDKEEKVLTATRFELKALVICSFYWHTIHVEDEVSSSDVHPRPSSIAARVAFMSG
jgi:hypothetical protein